MSKSRKVASEIQKAIQEICIKNCLDFESLKVSEKGDHSIIKIEVSEIIDGLNRFQINYLNNLHVHNLEEEWLYKQIIYKFERYQILGYYPKRYKNPIRIFNHTKQKDEFLHPDVVRKMWSCKKFYKGRT